VTAPYTDPSWDDRPPEPEPEYIEGDVMHQAPYLVAWCDTCLQNRAHGEWWMDDGYPVRIGMGCLTCLRINPYL
jgi:hypothetical protein